MRSLLRYFSFLLFFNLISVSVCVGQDKVISVDESAVRMRILDSGTVVVLPVRNSNQAGTAARVELQLLAPTGIVRASTSRDVSLRAGSNRLTMTLVPDGLQDKQNVLWYRLRYSVTPVKAAAASAVEGIFSVSEVTPDVFDLHVAGPAYLNQGARNMLRIKAQHPVTGRPVAGVNVQASLDLDTDDDALLVTQTAVTNRRGFATIEFTLPDKVDTNEIDTIVTGKLGDYSAEADGELRFNPESASSLSTDKALYQPGQTLHARLLALGADKKALANLAASISVMDPEGGLVYRTEATTSEFGIASADWAMPDSIRLGDYEIRAEFDDDRYADSGTATAVNISRYELPEFSVTAKPDKAFYLPEQNAEVEVRAQYLFGKPVGKGRVRVVREADRRWNFREQKWDVDEEASYEGDTDEQGRYIAHIDLTKDREKLGDSGYQRFRDVSLAAYFTDTSTGRTEQRRFDIRVTNDPIHIYVVQPTGLGTKQMPLEFYISADYADGTPAQCEVIISEVEQPLGHEDFGTPSAAEQVLRQVHTNRYGLAKISGIILARSLDGNSVDRPMLRLEARDRRGEVGHHTEDLYFYDTPEVRISTDKALYRPGELIQVSLTGPEQAANVAVEVAHASHVFASKLVRLDHGRATVTFDTDDKFEDEITLRAYALGLQHKSQYDGEVPHGVHTVLFPKNHELRMDIRLAKGVYRPGDEAAADIRVYGSDGFPERSALGLVVVDKAVEERERADREFNGTSHGWRGFYGFRDSDGEGQELGGIRRKDLEKVDLSKPLPDGFDLAAEILLQSYQPGNATFTSSDGDLDLSRMFTTEIERSVQPVRDALRLRYDNSDEYPKSESQLQDELEKEGIRFSQVRDPWGVPYRTAFRGEREMDIFEMTSAGPDKKFGTDNDFVCLKISWPYFRTHNEAIHNAVDEYHERTGRYIRDAQALKAELARHGEDFNAWKDPWGHDYELSFGIDRTRFTITVKSAGPSGKPTNEKERSGDIPVANVAIDYTSEMQARMDLALKGYFKSTGSFPSNVGELRRALGNSAFDWDSTKDVWGKPYYATFRSVAQYADKLNVQARGLGQPSTEIVPVTQQIDWIYIRCAGPDGVEGTPDDFDVAVFWRRAAERSAVDIQPVPLRGTPAPLGSGAISGVIADQTGGAIAGAEVTVIDVARGISQTVTTDENGEYTAANLSSGFYLVRAEFQGFQTMEQQNVEVRFGENIRVDIVLQPGAQTQTVTVTESRPELSTTNASVSALARTDLPKPRTAAPSQQLSTPRLREYFPETLYWQPELVTDGRGKAALKFPLADNVTTWKLSAVASTKNGEIGAAEKEIRAFQPFFIENDPPQFLTAGDEITLPVVLRNYLDRKIRVNAEATPGDWFSSVGATKTSTEIAARDSISAFFGLRASAPVKAGKFEVKARATEASDAVSRPVTVRPYGEEKTDSISQVFSQASSFDVNIPEAAIPGSLDVQLKIYPNLLAHLVESIEAILQRPYGCAEQTISSTYPSLLFLQYATQTRQGGLPLVSKTRRYVEIGYWRLLSYRAPDGGFSYWGRGGADLAVTAYAVKFLHDASGVIGVDNSMADEALDWLLSQQQADGRWVAHNWNNSEDARSSAILTAYIARTIAESEPPQDTQHAGLKKRISTTLSSALSYLKLRADSIDEPYLISTYALLAFDSGDQQAAIAATERLRKLEHREGDASYWSLETNTPFYGWGLAGRVETTALVLQALAKSDGAGRGNSEADAMLTRGLLFLLHSQDRYGVWYSTQTTVNVVQTIFSLTLAIAPGGESKTALAQEATIFVDGKQFASVDLPAANAIVGPVTTDLTGTFSPGGHHIEIRRASGSTLASLQLAGPRAVLFVAESRRHELLFRVSVAVRDQRANCAVDPIRLLQSRGASRRTAGAICCRKRGARR